MLDVKNEACVSECPARLQLRGRPDAVYPSGDCVACSSRVSACPLEAILYEDDVPGQWAQFTVENASFSGPPGSPAGASRTGPLPCGTGHVASCVTSGSGTLPGPGYSDGSATAGQAADGIGRPR
jgi:NAD-dependent dihydropyrimidine dehydrogenase PreA subunit